jgi:hypothetical protein
MRIPLLPLGKQLDHDQPCKWGTQLSVKLVQPVVCPRSRKARELGHPAPDSRGCSGTPAYPDTPTARLNSSASSQLSSPRSISPIFRRFPSAVNSTWLLSECHGVMASTAAMSFTGMSSFLVQHSAVRSQCRRPFSTAMCSTPKARQTASRSAITYHSTMNVINGRR